MEYTIYNHGRNKTIPVNGMNIFLARSQILVTEDKELAKALCLHEISVTPTLPESNVSVTRQALMKQAKKAGIPVSIKDTRLTLVNKLNETLRKV